MKLVIDDKIPFIKGEAEKLGNAIYLPGNKISAADVRDADVLITRTRTRCDAQLLKEATVKFVATATIGFDHIDTAFMEQAGIAWTNCPGCNATSVAQYVDSSLLVLAHDGLINLNDCTVGIIGVGNVGRRVAQRIEAIGCRVLLNDPPRAEKETDFAVHHSELSTLLNECDVITIHTPLVTTGNHPTLHLADERFFAQLRKRPVLINAGRGEVVCTEALLSAIDKAQVRAAIIDTWENEPHINLELLSKVYIGTPHIAGYSADGKANGTRMSLEAIVRHFGRATKFNVRPPMLPADFCYYPEGGIPADPRLKLYDPRRDSEALKQAPENFEALRGNYPLRRETFDPTNT